ncbi:MAG TPA: SDR family oxidoreductase [Candidatus Sulfopaludibacter sp.]|nr:SDR family oxidoreductase [Candidatus Sulfopaludibacter sp.]
MRGKVLIVTGSTGIAAAAARLAAAEGARLAIATADSGSGWALASETAAECWIGDLRRPGAADSVVSQCVSRFGRVDALFNAAGLSGRRFGDGPVHECTDEGWELTLAYNLASVFHMCRAAVARMLQQQAAEDGTRGAIVNLGSALVESPEPRHFAMHAYAAAKGGVEALTRSMAAYYAPRGIRVNAIAPGVVGTPATVSAAGEELSAFVARKQPLIGGMVDAQEIARAAIFLLGDETRPITGQVLTVDAGWGVTNT